MCLRLTEHCNILPSSHLFYRIFYPKIRDKEFERNIITYIYIYIYTGSTVTRKEWQLFYSVIADDSSVIGITSELTGTGNVCISRINFSHFDLLREEVPFVNLYLYLESSRYRGTALGITNKIRGISSSSPLLIHIETPSVSIQIKWCLLEKKIFWK